MGGHFAFSCNTDLIAFRGLLLVLGLAAAEGFGVLAVERREPAAARLVEQRRRRQELGAGVADFLVLALLEVRVVGAVPGQIVNRGGLRQGVHGQGARQRLAAVG